MKKKISIILGTRPEGIKLAPIIIELKTRSDVICHVCSTGQHREMLDQVLAIFGIKPDADLQLMRPNQTLAGLTSRVIEALDGYFIKEKPDLVLVQGDTTTVFCAALVAFYHRTPIGHVEAGLRTWDLNAPWPEEANRVLASRLTALHFAPTAGSCSNLMREGVPKNRIIVTGNTVIDALHLALRKVRKNPPRIPGLPKGIWKRRMVLITGHRRENFGGGFEDICSSIAELAVKFKEVEFIYPVHLNPNVREPVNRILGGGARLPNVHLIEPLSYLPFVRLMAAAEVVLTDSGGVQEEAPGLGKPVLVMRDVTERPEAVRAGTVKLVGTERKKIVREMSLLLTDKKAYRRMAKAKNPYGDGKAAPRIVGICMNYLKKPYERRSVGRAFEHRLKVP